MKNHLRYRYARDKADQLGQVFTPESVANLLINTIPVVPGSVGQIVDLGAGQGALTHAALKRFPKAKALLIEVDEFHADALISTMPESVSVINTDALDIGWESGINASILLSNPPYGMLPLTEAIINLLSKTKLNVPVNGNWIRGDAAFVARAWMCATRGTGVGLIIASPLVRDSAFRQLREVLVRSLQGLCITQLDTNVFSGAEVQAFLITGVRSHSRKRRVFLRKASIDGTIIDELEISSDEAVNRLDFDYYKAMATLGLPTSLDTLASVGTSIVRGSRSHNEFQKLGLDAFHTTTFKEFSGELSLNQIHSNYKIAQSGDILIPRVGSRCLNNQARVVKGKGLFTDCVYRLRTESHVRDRVWKTISSSFGAEWRLANASGNCAKHLTISTILEMPIVN